MGDIPYIAGMVINELGKPTKLVPILVSRNDSSTLARAYLTSDQAISHDSWTKVSGYTESWDIGSNFASNKYTAPVTGYYHVDAGILFNDPQSKLNLSTVAIYKNGVICVGTPYWSGTDKGWSGQLISDVIYLTVDQYIELYGYIQTSDSSAAVMLGGTTNTFISVHLIST